MTIGTFDTAVLNKVVQDLRQPSNFLLDMFFPNVQTSDDREIYFDIDESKPRITPFVHPTVAGQVVDDGGFSTKSFRPAYAKDKRVFDAQKPLKRTIGENIGGSMNPGQRLNAAINRAMTDQLEMLTRREAVMASEALVSGTVTVSGEKYPEVVVNFQRDAGLTVDISGGTAWSDTTAKGIHNLETWATLIQDTSGAVSTKVVMDPKAWGHFRLQEQTEKFLEYRRGTSNSINVDPLVRGEGPSKARYVGSVGEFDIYVYQEKYVDVDGTDKQMLPDNTVILAGADLEGTRGYGLIEDEKAGFKSQRYFTKSWMEEDPAIRWLLLQSAPLVFPYRPNASACITVA